MDPQSRPEIIPRIAIAKIHEKVKKIPENISLESQLHRHENESTINYIERTIKHLSSRDDSDLCGLFMRTAVKSIFFNMIVDQLPSLKIADTYDNKFIDIVLKEGNHDITCTFISAMLKKGEVDLEKAKQFMATIARSAPEELTPEQQSQLDLINNKLNKVINIDIFGDTREMEFKNFMLLLVKHNKSPESIFTCACENLSSQGIHSTLPILLAVSAVNVAENTGNSGIGSDRLVVNRNLDVINYIINKLKADNMNFLLETKIGEIIKQTGLKNVSIEEKYYQMPILDLLALHDFNCIDSIYDYAKKTNSKDFIGKFQEWRQKPEQEKYNIHNIIKTYFFETTKHITNLNEYYKEIERSSQRPGTYLTAAKEGDKGLIARQPQDTKELRQQLKKEFKEWLDFTINLSSDPLIKNKIPSLMRDDLQECMKFRIEIKNNQGQKDKYDIFLRGDCEICSLSKNGNEKIPVPNTTLRINPKLVPFLFKGDRFELISLTKARHETTQFWNNWENISAWDEYTKIVHPIIRDSVLRIVEKEELTNPVIMEVGGGTGRLARSIIDQINHKGEKTDYILLEYNIDEIQKAKSILGADASVSRTDIVIDELFYRDSEKETPIKEESVDVALASGVLTNVVLQDKEAALKALDKIRGYLKPRGYLILAGHASSLVDRDDLISNGFEVINTGMPQQMKELYIARKNPQSL